MNIYAPNQSPGQRANNPKFAEDFLLRALRIIDEIGEQAPQGRFEDQLQKIGVDWGTASRVLIALKNRGLVLIIGSKWVEKTLTLTPQGRERLAACAALQKRGCVALVPAGYWERAYNEWRPRDGVRGLRNGRYVYGDMTESAETPAAAAWLAEFLETDKPAPDPEPEQPPPPPAIRRCDITNADALQNISWRYVQAWLKTTPSATEITRVAATLGQPWHKRGLPWISVVMTVRESGIDVGITPMEASPSSGVQYGEGAIRKKLAS